MVGPPPPEYSAGSALAQYPRTASPHFLVVHPPDAPALNSAGESLTMASESPMALPHTSSVPHHDARKSRGAFFTPRAIATFLADWAIRLPTDAVFEPSCGEAAFLTAAARRLHALGATTISTDQLQGTDIDHASVNTAVTVLAEYGVAGQLLAGNFFDVAPSRTFDAVIGNPPYIRYQAFAGADRAKGLDAALTQGVRLSALSSSWAPFLVHATSFLAPAGRLALVLPAELLTVNYAAPLRRFLMQRFARVRLVLFDERVFPGVLAEVVLLLAEGHGPTTHCELHQAKNLASLNASDSTTWTPDDVEAPWLTGLLPAHTASLYADLAKGARFSPLRDWGTTNLGMVTGNNRYFTLSTAHAKELGLRRDEFLKISPPGSRHLRGLSFTATAWDHMARQGARTYLFAPTPARLSSPALRYIAAGEKAGVHTAYKCRVRSPWWKVPQVQVADAFLTYMNHETPCIVANRARVLSLNSVHGIVFTPGRRRIAMDLLPIALLNSLTLLGAELVGRAYGGGVLKLEPKEATRLPLPSFAAIRAAAPDLRRLRKTVAQHLQHGRFSHAVAAVDETLLHNSMKLHRRHIDRLRAARRALFGRRLARSRSNP